MKAGLTGKIRIRMQRGCVSRQTHKMLDVADIYQRRNFVRLAKLK